MRSQEKIFQQFNASELTPKIALDWAFRYFDFYLERPISEAAAGVALFTAYIEHQAQTNPADWKDARIATEDAWRLVQTMELDNEVFQEFYQEQVAQRGDNRAYRIAS